MCVIKILRSHSSNQGSSPTDSHDSNTSMCLFGQYCKLVGHSHIVYQDGETDICALCDTEEKFDIACWSLKVSSPTVEIPLTWDDLPSPPYAGIIELYNKTARDELNRILSKPIELSKCKFILHYVLALPYFIDMPPLIKIFGEKVGQWCGYRGGRELVHLAEDHGWDVELDYALDYAFKRQMNKKTERKKKKKKKQNKEHVVSSKTQNIGKAAH
ncbi:hypothetical protein F5Y12DRAFT_798553 [Xylaria sp. FL1777]|nr:hypothetical protein F5Y12DRAFT_798553 [Xylaria sp. FL1777]